ncbi:MAG: hypothetical protein WCC44_03015, partial [Azonexus sp.]
MNCLGEGHSMICPSAANGFRLNFQRGTAGQTCRLEPVPHGSWLNSRSRLTSTSYPRLQAISSQANKQEVQDEQRGIEEFR